MISDKLYDLFLAQTDLELTDEQQEVLGKLAVFITQSDERIFILRGYAGTGKSTIISIVAQTLKSMKMKSHLLAPTGRAAKVMNSYSGMPAYTIHKRIYRQKGSSDGFGKFALNFNKSKSSLFIVDEASMIDTETAGNSIFGSGNLFSDLMAFVFNDQDNKMMLVGDIAQLPPVKREKSFALDENFVKDFSFRPTESYTLTTIMRQAADSLIIKNASVIRNIPGDEVAISVEFQTGDPVIAVNGEDAVNAIEDSYNAVGQENTIVITRSNRAAVVYNQGIRNRILWKEEELSVGDQLMVVKNNYFWPIPDAAFNFIANGDMIVVDRIMGYEELYDLRFANILMHFLDFPEIEMEVKILLDVLSSNEASLNYDVRKQFYETLQKEYGHLRTKRKIYEAIRKDTYFNALEVKFAYAVTCHKSQGGQWQHVFIEQEQFNRSEPDVTYLKWIYTAMTRATEKVYLINFTPKFLK
ncbi:MAG: AAA family ATPase [Bacteroidales bacterium]|nr:AAA family ATPase [Bacteroidales bacterium]